MLYNHTDHNNRTSWDELSSHQAEAVSLNQKGYIKFNLIKIKPLVYNFIPCKNNKTFTWYLIGLICRIKYSFGHFSMFYLLHFLSQCDHSCTTSFLLFSISLCNVQNWHQGLKGKYDLMMNLLLLYNTMMKYDALKFVDFTSNSKRNIHIL